VYNVAGELWPYAEAFARSVLRDPAAGLPLMLLAAATVTRRRGEPGVAIQNLKAFLGQVYKNLVLAEIKKLNHRRELEAENRNEIQPVVRDPKEELDRKILLEQLVLRMDEWTRQVFEWKVIGHTYDTIGQWLGMKANHVRSEYSKRISKLRDEVDRDNREAALKIADAASGPPEL
jgi:DNA-directed RNA polymerase specialized sigma24 family protein